MNTYEKKYKEALSKAKDMLSYKEVRREDMEYLFPELAESEDEKIRNEIIQFLQLPHPQFVGKRNHAEWIAWLEEQGQQKEINLDKILKHYPRETELYSPLYGKLWLAEVDEEWGIITCYKHPLDEGCTRAILKQEDTVSFYSNGTTGLPDFSVSDECMLFLYDSENQGKQKPTQKIGPFEAEHGKYYYCIKDYYAGGNKRASKGDVIQALRGLSIMGLKDASEYFLPVNFINGQQCNSAWSEEDEKKCQETIGWFEKRCFPYALEHENPARESIKWLKSLKERIKP